MNERARIVALLSYYDESPSWLAATVASMRGLVSHVIAVDGAYAFFPGANLRPNSGPDQADAVARTAAACGIGCTTHVQTEPFYGNEVEKRQLMFELGRLVTTENDWFLSIDADEVITSFTGDVHQVLADAREDVAGVHFWNRNAFHPLPRDERRQPAPDSLKLEQLAYEGAPPPAMNAAPTVEGHIGHRVLFRALRDLRVERAHYLYIAGPAEDPRFMRGPHDLGLEPLVEVEVSIEHRHAYRRAERNGRGKAYYDRRDSTGIERIANTYLETPSGGQSLQGPGRAG